MTGPLERFRQIVAPRLSDDQRRLVEIIKRDPHIRVVGRGLVVRTGFTDEGRERFNQKAAELAELVHTGRCGDKAMTLPHTEPLCTGTIIGSTDLYCKERHTCQRYTEWQKWLNQYEPARGITAFAAQPGCNKKIVVEEK